MSTIAKLISGRPEILAVEWLNKKIKFGSKAELSEMSAFKSKVKKVTPPGESVTNKQVIDMGDGNDKQN